jgi:hypothetical protein
MLFIACVIVLMVMFIFFSVTSNLIMSTESIMKTASDLKCFCVWCLVDCLSRSPSCKLGNSATFSSSRRQIPL